MLPHLYYRRRKCDGREHTSHWFGAGRVVCDTAAVLVVDWALPAPELLRHSMGNPVDTPRLRLFNLDVLWQYSRHWWWRSHPLNIMAVYDVHGNLILQGVDFATPAITVDNQIWQTDLYLDCFVGADGQTWLVEDEDDVAEAYECGLLSADQRSMIEHELQFVINHVENETWFAWLESLCNEPFDPKLLSVARSYDEMLGVRA